MQACEEFLLHYLTLPLQYRRAYQNPNILVVQTEVVQPYPSDIPSSSHPEEETSEIKR